jgi:hypothetical protein
MTSLTNLNILFGIIETNQVNLGAEQADTSGEDDHMKWLSLGNRQRLLLVNMIKKCSQTDSRFPPGHMLVH